MVTLLFVASWMTAGALACSLVASRRGRNETDWLILGAALGPIALYMLAASPAIRPPSFLLHDPRQPRLVECPACRRVVAPRAECPLCCEPLPGDATNPEEGGPSIRG